MSATANSTEDDAIGDAAEQATAAWEGLIEPMTVPIEQLVDRSQSLVQIRDGLAGLAAKLDVEPMRDRLAQALFSGRLGGDAAIGRETQVTAS